MIYLCIILLVNFFFLNSCVCNGLGFWHVHKWFKSWVNCGFNFGFEDILYIEDFGVVCVHMLQQILVCVLDNLSI